MASSEYGISVILKDGAMLQAPSTPDINNAKLWARKYSANVGVARVIITQTETRVVLGYKDGKIERPNG